MSKQNISSLLINTSTEVNTLEGVQSH